MTRKCIINKYFIKISELLSSWESLLSWSENAAVARQLQEEMSILKGSLNRLGTQFGTFDSEDGLLYAIDELKVSFVFNFKVNKCVVVYITQCCINSHQYSLDSLFKLVSKV